MLNIITSRARTIVFIHTHSPKQDEDEEVKLVVNLWLRKKMSKCRKRCLILFSFIFIGF